MKFNLIALVLALLLASGCRSNRQEASSSSQLPQGEKVYVAIPGKLGDSQQNVKNLMREIMRPKGTWKTTPLWLNFDEFSSETRQIYSAPIERADFSRGTFVTVLSKTSDTEPKDEYLGEALQRVASMLEQTTAQQPVRAYIVTEGIDEAISKKEIEDIADVTSRLAEHKDKLAQLCLLGVSPENRKATTDLLARTAPDKVKVATWAEEEWRRCL
jgi:hypothetical protein